MCGIIGVAGDRSDEVLDGLQRLEYRGYDSAGVVYGEERFRTTEGINTLPTRESSSAVAHTRWATNGKPSISNAHPHTDCDDNVYLVHNGIIENNEILKEELSSHTFDSDTDTEVIPHLIESYINQGKSRKNAIRKTARKITGSYAIISYFADSDTLYAVRNNSPLWLAIDEDSNYITSDINSIVDWTKSIVRIGRDEIVTVTNNRWQIETIDGHEVHREIEQAKIDSTDIKRGSYKHITLKEIHEQPHAIEQTIAGLSKEEVPNISNFGRVEFIAAGTSYNAANYISNLLRENNIIAEAFKPEQYTPVSGDVLTIAVSQSGETADTKRALQKSPEPRLLVTNTVSCSMEQYVDYVSYTNAGPEVGVGATKTFTSQLIQLLYLIGVDKSVLQSAPNNIFDTIKIDIDLNTNRKVLFVAPNEYKPIAEEASLKFTEWTYLQSTALGSKELKHGPLALVDNETTVVMIPHPAESQKETIEQIKARGGNVITLEGLPAHNNTIHPIVVMVWLQRFAYWNAREMNRDIDKPRNLAKSVTV